MAPFWFSFAFNDWTAYRASIQRLAEFVASRAVTYVIGAHVEMTSTPGVNYPYQTVYQPNEHVLQLTAEHVLELDRALRALGRTPPSGSVALDDDVACRRPNNPRGRRA